MKQTLKAGDKVTIAGVEFGSKGQMLIDGVSVETKRKCKPMGLMQLTLGPDVTSETNVMPQLKQEQ